MTIVVLTLTMGFGLELRALFHVIVHGESSFLADAMKALLIIGLGALLFWSRRK